MFPPPMRAIGIQAGRMPRFSYRDASANDLRLTYEITRDAMRKYVEQTWGEWNEAEQIQKHRDSFTPVTHRIICIGEKEAGVVAVEDLPDHVWLVKLYLLAKARGQGIGSAVLRDVIGHAERLGLPIRLRVLRVNEQAQALYARHGFRIAGETPERCFMVRAPGAA
jgi:ribosomal protein S18 acetylase RimI-like enzyme